MNISNDNHDPEETPVDGDELLDEAARIADPLGEADLPEDATDDVSDEVAGPEAETVPPSSETPPPPPGANTTAAPYPGLVRDPYARLGGVASGIAHRYGWDVALTRLGFVAAFIISAGSAVLLYLLAWLIIPRATYWPPTRRNMAVGDRFSSRDLGVGFVVLAALIVLLAGGGEVGAILVPLALVGGGVWLLMQEPRSQTAPAMAAAASGASPAPPAAGPTASVTPQDAPASGFGDGVDWSGGGSGPEGPAGPVGAPVPPKPRSRRLLFGILFGILGLVLLAFIAIPIAFFWAVSEGEVDFDFDSDNQVTWVPESPGDIPTNYDAEDGELILNLTALDDSDFVDGVVSSRIELDAGKIQVIVPDDLSVDIDAESRLGAVEVFGAESNGVGADRIFSDDDAVLELELDLSIGEIVVERP